MGTKKRKRKTLTAPSSRRRRGWENDHVDWESLPQDIVLIILSKLRQTDILGGGAGLAFPSWRRLALEEALLWRLIDLGGSDEKAMLTCKEQFFWLWNKPPHAGWKAMALAAVDGNAGRCESFAGHVDIDVLVHLANSAPLLKSLNVTGWPYVSDGKLITEIIRKFPLLERVVLRGGEFQEALLLALLDHCRPRLELLDASLSRPMFRVWAEPIATRIRRASNTIKYFNMPDFILY